MKKKILTTIIMSVICLTIVSAVLVDYLSNTATLTGTVSSPLLVELDGDLNIYGGETTLIYQTITNQANANIPASIYNTVTNPSGITCADFKAIRVDNVWGNHACVDVNSNTVMITVFNDDGLYAPNTIEEHEYELTFLYNATGDYSFNTVMKTI